MSTVKIAAVQMAMSPEPERNLRKTLERLREAAEHGARLVCFPEGHLGLYVAQYPDLKTEDFAWSLEHPYIRKLLEACREYGVFGCFSVCLREKEGVRSAGLLVSEEGKLLSVDRKKHIVRTEHYYEQDYFTPGDGGFAVTETGIGRLGMIICFDRHYPESFRSLALQDCALAVVPVANDRTEPQEIYQWEMRIPAFQNGMYTMMINRVGREGSMDFSGGSLIAAPDGSLLALAGEGEEIVYAEADFSLCAEQRRKTQYLSLLRQEVFDIKRQQ